MWHLAGEDGDAAHVGGAFGGDGAVFGLHGGEGGAGLFEVVGGGVAGGEAALDVAQHVLQGTDAAPGGFQTAFGGAGLEVVVGDVAGDEQLCAVELFLPAEGGVAGGVGIAAFLAEDVGLP